MVDPCGMPQDMSNKLDFSYSTWTNCIRLETELTCKPIERHTTNIIPIEFSWQFLMIYWIERFREI